MNPKQLSFIEVPRAKGSAQPAKRTSQWSLVRPVGAPQPGKPESGIYHVRLDGTYSNTVSDPFIQERSRREGIKTMTCRSRRALVTAVG